MYGNISKTETPSINYPKKRVKVRDLPVIGIQEPKRKTMFDVLSKNFELISRKTFLHRIVYTGNHNSQIDSDEMILLFSSSVNKVNEENDFNESLTGFLILYPGYFVHMVEGDENAINSHVAVVLNDKFTKILSNLTLVTFLSHLNRRLINDWGYFCGVPLELQNIPKECNGIYQPTVSCVTKLYNLINKITEDYETSRSSMFVKRKASNTGNVESLLSQKISLGAGVLSNNNDYSAHLPEYHFLEYIIKYDMSLSLTDFLRRSKIVPQREIYKDMVWPVPLEFDPEDTFQKVYNRVLTLPKDNIIRFASEEEEKDGSENSTAPNI